MEYAFSIIMAAFSAAILLFAGLMGLAGDYKMIPYRARASVKPKNPKKYARQLAKVLALVAIAPALGALVGLWHPGIGGVVLVAACVLLIWLGTKFMKDAE
ncbi:MAG: hypothetical protein IJU41_02450 [Clostridia bacterium]|nr:hypothetical protein [Clostridia bacterium]